MITLNLNQIKILLEMCGDDDEITTELVIEERADGYHGSGLYAYDSEYPEEGSVFLDPALEKDGEG